MVWVAALFRAIAWRRFVLLWGLVLVSVAGLGAEDPAITDRRYRATERRSKIENRNSKIETRKYGFANRKSKIQNLKSESPTAGTPSLLAGPETNYSTFLGGSGSDVATDVAVDAAGNVYVIGYSNSPDFPSGAPGLFLPGGGTCGDGLDIYPCFDVFVAKFDPTGHSLAYLARFGGSGDDYATGIAIDSLGNAYVTGYTNSTDFPTNHAAQAQPGEGACGVAPTTFPCYDAFVVKLDGSGSTLAYATYLGGAADDFGQGIAVDSAGYAVVTGFTASPGFPVRRPLQRFFGGAAYDAFLAKIPPAGTPLVYSTFLGGSGDDFGSKVALDSTGAAYATGYTNSANFPVAGAFQSSIGDGMCGAPPSSTPCFDAFVTKVSGDGAALLYSTYLGGSGGDYGYGIAVDSTGRAYVTGSTTSTGFPVTPGAVKITGGGTTVDAFVTKLDADGSQAVYSTYLGGLGSDAGLDISVDSLGNAYCAGSTYGSGFPVASPIQAASGGFYDAFLAKLNGAGSALVFSSYLGGSGNDKARGVALDSAGNAWMTGETFSSDFPTTTGAFQPSFGSGAFDGFVTKLTGLALPVTGLSETSINFSSQGVGTTSVGHAITLSNAGDAALDLADVVPSGDYAETNDCGASVAPGVSCTLWVTFSPQDWGPRIGALTLASNAYGSPEVISLLGTGAAAPAVSLSPISVTFPDQTMGTTSAAQNVIVTNTGQAALNVTGINVTGDFGASTTCGFEIAVEASCTIAVTFTPKSPRKKLGTLAISDNAPGSPHLISLTGVGLATSVPLPPVP